MVADISAVRNASPNPIPGLPKRKSEHSGVRVAPHNERPMGRVYEMSMLPKRCMLADDHGLSSSSEIEPLDF